MALRGIDISAWQPDINIPAVDCDFVIVKATGGTGYTNPEFRRQADAALASGKLLGLYHFAGDGCAGTAAQEAAHFLQAFAPYRGKAIPVLDWEAEACTWPVAWAKTWLDTVARETGATPWFYSYSSYLNNSDCTSIASYPLWIAAYYAGYQEMGYQDNPPLYGGTGAWMSAAAYQYSSSGRVAGYGGRLDISIFYGSRADWLAMAGGKTSTEWRDDMAECIFWIKDDHCGFAKGLGVYWSASTGFAPLAHIDDVELLRKCHPGIAEIDSSKKAPWVMRAYECLGAEAAKRTYPQHK